MEVTIKIDADMALCLDRIKAEVLKDTGTVMTTEEAIRQALAVAYAIMRLTGEGE